MANILSKITNGNVIIIVVDIDPSTGGGTVASKGSFAVAKDGSGFYYKFDNADIDWIQGATSNKLAMFYGLTTGTGNGGVNDYPAPIAVKTSAGTGRVPFPRDGAAFGIVRNDASSFLLPDIGIYDVTFNVHTTEEGQLQLELNGVALDFSTASNANPTSGGHEINGTCLVVNTVPNSELAVINPTGNGTALTITTVDGVLTHAMAQRITISKR
jgi:hypothetical protein